MTLLPEASSSACSLVSKQQEIIPESPCLGPRSHACNLWHDLDGELYEYHAKGPPATDAAVAVATGNFFDLGWPSDELTNAAEEEARILDDLLRLGLELGDLEEVFGNTEVDDCVGSRGSEEEEAEGYAGNDGDNDRSSDRSLDADSSDTEACCCVQECCEEDAEELLLDSDLQEALLALPEMDPADGQEEEGDEEGLAPASTATLTVAAMGPKMNSTSSPPATGAASPVAAVASPMIPQAAAGLICADAAENAVEDQASAVDDAVIAGVDVAVALEEDITAVSDGNGGGGSGDDTNPNAAADDGNADGDVHYATKAADVASVSLGVPVHVLDAVDMWESAFAKEMSRMDGGSDDGVATAKAASSSRAKAISNGKKKMNEFGKRRRSSGGGTAPAPGGRLTNAGKVKVDPLVALKDVRCMSRKPLIVQWLRSDGCESDAEAESVVGTAVGSLASIHSHYWGSGGG